MNNINSNNPHGTFAPTIFNEINNSKNISEVKNSNIKSKAKDIISSLPF